MRSRTIFQKLTAHSSVEACSTTGRSNMDEQTYREAVRRLRVGGWRYIEFGEIDSIESAAEARHDLATLILVDVMMERDDTFPR
jgi:hypothetical protein